MGTQMTKPLQPVDLSLTLRPRSDTRILPVICEKRSNATSHYAAQGTATESAACVLDLSLATVKEELSWPGRN